MMRRLREKRFDLLRADERSGGRRELRRIAQIVLPVALCVAVLTTFGVQKILIARGEEELAALEGYFADGERQSYYEEAQLLLEEQRTEQTEQYKLNQTRLALGELPALTQEAVEAVRQAASGSASIREMAYTESDGTLTVLAASATVGDAAQFAQNLKETGIFDELSYSGYQADGGGEYEFLVEGVLRGGAADGSGEE